MDEEIRKTILSALGNYAGDDLYRMKAAVRGWTTVQMQQQWGQSGRTAQDVLDDYQKHADRVAKACEWVSSQ